MPMFFFDFQDGDGQSMDDQGTELASKDDARDEAVRALAGIAHDMLPVGGADHRELKMVVLDDGRRPLFSLSVAFTLTALD